MLIPPASVTVAQAVPPVGTVRVPGETETHVPEVALTTLREQLSPLPVSSWKATDIPPFTALPPVKTPKLTDAGDNVAGVFIADPTLIRPPPRDIGLARGAPLLGFLTGRSALFTSADFTSAGAHSEWAARRNAAEPAVCATATGCQRSASFGSAIRRISTTTPGAP